MVNTKIMWSAIFSSLSHPCVVTDELTDVIVGVDVDMLSEMIAGMPAALIIDVVSATDVDMLADGNVNGLAAVMTPLGFALPAPCEESMTFC